MLSPRPQGVVRESKILVIPKISDFRMTPQSAPADKERSREGIQRRLWITFTLCRGFTTGQSKTGTVMANTHRLGLEPDNKGGRDRSCHHHRVGVGHSESTPAETALPARMVGTSRASVKKRVAEPGSPTLSERVSTSRVG